MTKVTDSHVFFLNFGGIFGELSGPLSATSGPQIFTQESPSYPLQHVCLVLANVHRNTIDHIFFPKFSHNSVESDLFICWITTFLFKRNIVFLNELPYCRRCHEPDRTIASSSPLATPVLLRWPTWGDFTLHLFSFLLHPLVVCR